MAADQEHWVARPGELVTGSVETAATRVGGLPLFPAGCSVPAPALTACRACGKQLALVLQAHAPLTCEQTGGTAQQQRYVYLYGCTQEGCGKEPGCWRALRVTAIGSRAGSRAGGQQQQQQQQPQPPPAAQPLPPAPAPLPVPAADDWGVSGADDWGAGGGDDWGADTGASSIAAFDFGDLNAALDAASSAAAAKAAAPSKQAQPPAAGSSTAKGPAYSIAQPSLPAFYLYAEAESACGVDDSATGPSQAEQEHLAQLVARYEAETGAAGEAAPGSAATGQAAAAAACTPAIEGGPESWAGEGYEEDHVLAPTGGKRAGMDAAFFRFTRRLGRCPDQCARYSFGGTPLWPSSEPPAAAAPCPACGGRCVFELQLMTPLIPALLESAEWLKADSSAAAAAAAATLQPPDSWEWLTVCMYSCAASCCGGSAGPAVVEELVVLANEEN